MKLTDNFGLKKPEANEYYNVEDFNANAEIIDEEMKKAQEMAGSHAARHAEGGEDPITPEDIGAAALGKDGKVLSSQLPEVDYALSNHGHTIENVTGLQSALDGKAAASHTHAIANVTNLQSALDGKAASSHTHTLAALGAAAASHNHSASDITSDTLPVARGGTGITSNPSMLTNLGSTSAASVFAASPRPGVTGVLPVANGGTGVTSLEALATAMGAAKIEVGSYTGTGTSGSGSPNTLTFSFVPKVVIIYPLSNGSTYIPSALIMINESETLRNVAAPFWGYQNSSYANEGFMFYSETKYTFSGKTVSWYGSYISGNVKKNYEYTPYLQMNVNPWKYAYVAIG